MEAVTLKDVARLAGVHPATASRALNPQTRLLVSEDTAKRVLVAAEQLGYRPNTVARSLRTRRSHTVGVLIPDLTNPMFPPMVRGLEDRLGLDGYVALIGNTDGDAERERTIFEQMQARHVDGFALATAQLRNPVLTEAARAELPVVLMNRVAEDLSFPAVTTDNERGVRLEIGHLAALGHTRIACVAGPQELSTGHARYRGFVTGLREAGLEVRPELVSFARAFSIAEGRRCAAELLAGPVSCTAIVAGNDMLAVGCYLALDDAGRSCPDDVSVVGFNDMPFIDMLRPPLTTIAFSHYQVGAEAAELLIERMDGTAEAVRVLSVAPELVIRGSTAAPAARR
ncbi:MAG TPA: LacI family DNA-binding transcriptional regulator [Streptosporangiaceae bacterium]